MSTCITEASDEVAAREQCVTTRTRMIADALMLRALAFRALRDGLPKPELRAANARGAARKLLQHARRIARASV